MKASDMLTEAARIVGGDRNTTHGEKERSFRVIADLWNAYLEGRKTPGPVSPRDVAQMMALMKIGRSVQGTPHPDHFLDQAGYSAIAGELAALEKLTTAPVEPVAPAPRDPWAPGNKVLCVDANGRAAVLTEGRTYGIEAPDLGDGPDFVAVRCDTGAVGCFMRNRFRPVPLA